MDREKVNINKVDDAPAAETPPEEEAVSEKHTGRYERLELFLIFVILFNILSTSNFIGRSHIDNHPIDNTFVIVMTIMAVFEIIICVFIMQYRKWALLPYFVLVGMFLVISLMQLDYLTITGRAFLLILLFSADWKKFNERKNNTKNTETDISVNHRMTLEEEQPSAQGNPSQKKRFQGTGSVKTKLLALFFLLTVLSVTMFILLYNASVVRANLAKLPTVVTERDGKSATIIFVGYNTCGTILGGLMPNSVSVLPLSDGSYLVGLIRYTGTGDDPPGDSYPAFFRLDKDWNFVAEVPFDAEEYLNGNQAREIIDNDEFYSRYYYSDEERSIVQYTFETNVIRSGRTDSREREGRLEELHTDFGVIGQTHDMTGRNDIKFTLYRCYYYDFASNSVKIAPIPELNERIPESGSFYEKSFADAYLLYGYLDTEHDNNYKNRSFVVLHKGTEVLWTRSREISRKEYEEYRLSTGLIPKIYQGDHSCLLVWPTLTGKQDYEFSLLFSDGFEISVPPVTLPDQLTPDDIQACFVRETEPLLLAFQFGNDRWLSLNQNGIWSPSEPFEWERDDKQAETDDYQFFASAFALRMDKPHPGMALYEKHYTSIWERNRFTGEFKGNRRFVGICLEVIHSPLEKNLSYSRDLHYCVSGR